MRHKLSRWLPRLAVPIIVLAGLIGGCGDDDDKPTPMPGGPGGDAGGDVAAEASSDSGHHDAPPSDALDDSPASDAPFDTPPEDAPADAPPQDAPADAPPDDAPPADAPTDAPNTDAAPDAVADAVADTGSTAPILTSSHSGWSGNGSWQNKNCYRSGCHSAATLPGGHDVAWNFAKCAECHGANGACDANGNTHVHTTGDNCMNSACHGSHHGYNTNPDCVACHMAWTGMTDCSP